MRIKYIAFYDIDQFKKENRVFFPSTISKVNYICEILNQIDVSVDIISTSWTLNKFAFYHSREKDISDNIRLLNSSTFGVISSKLVIFQKIYSWLWLLSYLIFKTKNGEKIIIYHGMNRIIPLMIAKRLRKLKYILEVEEIYSELRSFPNWKRNLEMKMISLGDKYVFASELLKNRINDQNKPSCILYGNYKVEDRIAGGFGDNRVHILYAGIINESKGAFKSVQVAQYLTSEYHIHILGYGDDKNIDILVKSINEINKVSYAKVSYDGLLTGIEYLKFIQNCHIGLCPQISDKTYNKASFPSKISSYLTNGLRVVCTRNYSIDNSPFSRILFYSETDSPMEVAKTISCINLEEYYDSKEFMLDLDKEFRDSFSKLVQ